MQSIFRLQVGKHSYLYNATTDRLSVKIEQKDIVLVPRPGHISKHELLVHAIEMEQFLWENIIPNNKMRSMPLKTRNDIHGLYKAFMIKAVQCLTSYDAAKALLPAVEAKGYDTTKIAAYLERVFERGGKVGNSI